MAHTPEPWLVRNGDVWVPPTEQDLKNADDSVDTDMPFAAEPFDVATFTDVQDAERAALCVNACEGVSETVLKAVGSMPKGKKRPIFIRLYGKMYEALKLARDRGRFSRKANDLGSVPQFDDPLAAIQAVIDEIESLNHKES